MRLEDMKSEFPKMPEDMRTMVEREVERQVRMQHTPQHLSVKKAAIIILAATMLLGTTVFAGVKMYQMNKEAVGDYAVKTYIQGDENTLAGDTQEGMPEVPLVIAEVGYLPEGMVEMEKDIYSYEDTPYQGGVSILCYFMDTGNDAFQILDTNVSSSEKFQAGEHEGVYLQFQSTSGQSSKVYLAFPEFHHVVVMYIGSDVPKEEAIEMAKGLSLREAEPGEEGLIMGESWSYYLESLQEIEEDKAPLEEDFKLSVPKEEMENTHSIGESFSGTGTQLNGAGGLEICVTDVQILDNIGILNPIYVENSLREITDSNGNLLPAEVRYIKNGDGINSVDEIIETREVNQKLVYVTVEYKNTGITEMKSVMYSGNILKIKEVDGMCTILSAFLGNKQKEEDGWDRTETTGMEIFGTMPYYDVRGNDGGGDYTKNYITCLKPEETVIVHMGFIVNDENMDCLYLNLDTFSGCLNFAETALDMGYVDIRQKN